MPRRDKEREIPHARTETVSLESSPARTLSFGGGFPPCFRTACRRPGRGERRATRWLCSEATANESLRSNSLIIGKIQGILTKSGQWFTLEASVLNGFAVKFPTTWSREYMDANSEFSLQQQGPPSPSTSIPTCPHLLEQRTCRTRLLMSDSDPKRKQARALRLGVAAAPRPGLCLITVVVPLLDWDAEPLVFVASRHSRRPPF